MFHVSSGPRRVNPTRHSSPTDTYWSPKSLFERQKPTKKWPFRKDFGSWMTTSLLGPQRPLTEVLWLSCCFSSTTDHYNAMTAHACPTVAQQDAVRKQNLIFLLQ